MVPVAVA
ncbi:hypothetical protein VCHC81A2_2793, partial [Vibrio cholerae HC-81A2]